MADTQSIHCRTPPCWAAVARLAYSLRSMYCPHSSFARFISSKRRWMPRFSRPNRIDFSSGDVCLRALCPPVPFHKQAFVHFASVLSAVRCALRLSCLAFSTADRSSRAEFARVAPRPLSAHVELSYHLSSNYQESPLRTCPLSSTRTDPNPIESRLRPDLRYRFHAIWSRLTERRTYSRALDVGDTIELYSCSPRPPTPAPAHPRTPNGHAIVLSVTEP